MSYKFLLRKANAFLRNALNDYSLPEKLQEEIYFQILHINTNFEITPWNVLNSNSKKSYT